MSNAPILAHFLKNPYAWGFVLYWVGMLVACATLWMVESRHGKPNKTLESSLFWLFGLAMLAFMVFRPIGIARDDLAYLEIYKTICPTLTCDQWLQGVRDVGWYASVGLLKSVVSDPRVMLWLGAAALLVKLAVMYSLAKRPLIVLLLYTGLYYQVQDLTAWRVSLALAFFMLAIWLVVRTRQYWNAWILSVCGLFHKQAFVAPLILVGVLLRKHRLLITFICLIPVVMLVVGLYPPLHLIASQIGRGAKEIAFSQGLDPYVGAKLAGAYSGWRQAPIVFYPQILMTIWLVMKVRPCNEKLDAMLIGCLVIGCLFLWGFASLPDAQVRFFEFFMVPTVLLAGVRRLSAVEFAGVVFVSGLVVAKYNMVHQLIVQP